MKLIDLLVQELPKRGGWPEGSKFSVQSIVDSEIYFYINGMNESAFFRFYPDRRVRCTDGHYHEVTREQYEAALAASQQPAWNGEGLPPVGCECELFDCENWNPVIIKFVGDKYVVTERTDLGYEVVYCVAERPDRFRPIRSEADRKREEVGLAIYHAINWNSEGELVSPSRMEDYRKAYDAIAAGKIPGIRIE